MKNRCCKECGSPVDGRSDKVFCTDACRVAFHNKTAGETRKSMLRNVRGLLKNYRILSVLPFNQEVFLPSSMLRQLGFDFDVHTLELSLEEGEVKYYCFDIAYKRNDSGVIVCRRDDNTGGDPGGGGGLCKPGKSETSLSA